MWAMNPLLVKLAARAAVQLAKRTAFRAAAQRLGRRKTLAGLAAAHIAARLIRRKGR